LAEGLHAQPCARFVTFEPSQAEMLVVAAVPIEDLLLASWRLGQRRRLGTVAVFWQDIDLLKFPAVSIVTDV